MRHSFRGAAPDRDGRSSLPPPFLHKKRHSNKPPSPLPTRRSSPVVEACRPHGGGRRPCVGVGRRSISPPPHPNFTSTPPPTPTPPTFTASPPHLRPTSTSPPPHHENSRREGDSTTSDKSCLPHGGNFRGREFSGWCRDHGVLQHGELGRDGLSASDWFPTGFRPVSWRLGLHTVLPVTVCLGGKIQDSSLKVWSDVSRETDPLMFDVSSSGERPRAWRDGGEHLLRSAPTRLARWR